MLEEEELKRHILDLAERSYAQNIYTFSDFLTLGEISQVHSFENEFNFVKAAFFGGCDGCERQMVRFGSEDELGYVQDFPIRTLEVKPLNAKFADSLSHRDFLGAIMNLGVNRDVLGDIIVRDNTGYIFASESMAEYLCDNLNQVKHTTVVCNICDKCPESAKPVFEMAEIIISSNRCDAVISKLYNLSRTQSSELFRKKLVFVDGRSIEKPTAVLKSGAVVSVRGYGKFVFDGIISETRKGREKALLRKYV